MMQEKIQKRIFEYRRKRGFTLKQLAERASCTPSYISQIEKGITVPSLSMVGRLAAALDIPVIELFSGEMDEDNDSGYLCQSDRKIINYPDGNVASHLLVKRISKKKMEPLISIIKPGGKSDVAENMTHPVGTEEFVFVLKGQIDFKIKDKGIRLRRGDTLSFSGELPHSWANNSRKNAEVLFVFSPPIW